VNRESQGSRCAEDALLRDTKKGEWAFVAVCVAGAIICGTWSVKLGIAHYKAQPRRDGVWQFRPASEVACATRQMK
jgi:hypothetical protein